MSLEDEAKKVARVSPLHGEPRQHFLRRVAVRLSALPGAGAESLSPELYRWTQAAAAALQVSEPLQEFDVAAPGSLIAQLVALLLEEDAREGERLSNRRAARPSDAQKELRQRAQEWAIQKLLVERSMTGAQLSALLSAEGFPTSERSAKTIIGYVTRVLRAMRTLGWRVEDATGERVLL